MVVHWGMQEVEVSGARGAVAAPLAAVAETTAPVAKAYPPPPGFTGAVAAAVGGGY